MEKLSSKINFKDLGLIKYEHFLTLQQKLTPLKENFLLFATLDINDAKESLTKIIKEVFNETKS